MVHHASQEIQKMTGAGWHEGAGVEGLGARYARVRSFTEELARPLAAEDCVIQSMPDASPTKWHLGHTSWFFETFVLRAAWPHSPPYHPKFGFIFNSYYNAAGERHSRPHRGLLSRPTVPETYRYRAHVDERMGELLERVVCGEFEQLRPVIVLGLHHEEQHQELILTDIKHALAQNPLRPAYRDVRPANENPVESSVLGMAFREYAGGTRSIGYEGQGFCFDNEMPRHNVLVPAFQLAERLVTNREYLAFMKDGGYGRPDLWLSDGWTAAQEGRWSAPLYWEPEGDGFRVFTLDGMKEVQPAEPVCHVSYYEADAYARWANARLPLEAEWEVAAEEALEGGNFVESGNLHPSASGPPDAQGERSLRQLFGDVWEWTASPYMAYPGYRPWSGALGEYNGKFMCNQMVLRGGSCVTPRRHIRATYRNFFPPGARWQFSGIRLARDV
jgi:ergothioneine biosynthesis protein EgtB